MSALPVQVFSGPDAVRGAEAVRRSIRTNQENWPYPHVYPPVNTLPVHAITLVPVEVPAVGVQVVVLQYQVPSGFRFVMQGIVQQIQGGVVPFPWGAGAWTVDVDAPLGVANVQASPVQGLTALTMPLGSFNDSRPWQLLRAYEFEPLCILRSKFTNAAYGVGAPNVLASGFFGYLIPSVKSR